jgi:hypothetical protein
VTVERRTASGAQRQVSIVVCEDEEEASGAQRRVSIVVCEDEEDDESCERRGYVGVHGGDDTRSSAHAHVGGGCCNVVRHPWQDVRKEITHRVGGTWSVQYTCVINFSAICGNRLMVSMDSKFKWRGSMTP